MEKFSLIEQKMKDKGVTDKMVAENLHIDLSTWYRRKLQPKKMTIGEAEILKDVLEMTSEEASFIFFS